MNKSSTISFEQIRSPFRLLFSKKNWELRQMNRNSTVITYSATFLAFISFCLTILNVYKCYWFMTGTTAVLTVGMLAAALFSRKNRNLIAALIMELLVSGLFSIYAITGQNEGFAILWIVLVPIIALNLLNIEMGTILSTYFLVFLFVIFYTPLKNNVGEGNYSSTFMMRFPFLYLCAFGGAFILAMNKEQNYVIKTIQSYTDGLTGLFNRARYIMDLESDEYDRVSVCSVDLNGLKRVNDTGGHEAGDRLIIMAADILTRTWAKSGRVYRLGGDEFMVISPVSCEKMKEDVKRCNGIIDAINSGNEIKVSFSLGYSSSDIDGTANLVELSRIADARMYDDKAAYYSVKEHERRK